MSVVEGEIGRIRKLLEGNVRLLPRAGGTKPALSTPARGEQPLDMTAFSGMLEYVPEEFTFTAYAGTRLAEIAHSLSQNGQFLPFDPPLVERGATLGGTVASGLSGSGRYRYGGVRDFILGVRFIDGRGQLLRAGGKVVKNVAGYDFPKLMVGSHGSLGILVDLSFKVFPEPTCYATWQRTFDNLAEAIQMMQRASRCQIPLEAMDLQFDPQGYSLWLRIGGLSSILQPRIERLVEVVGEGQLIDGNDDEKCWREVREFTWLPEGYNLVKVALTPKSLLALEGLISDKPFLRRYVAGGQMAWIAMDDPPRSFETILLELGLTGLTLIGPPGFPHLGEIPGKYLLRKVKDTLDPAYRFTEI